jgi:N-acetyl-anhydromuramyl-L-alanine amidase AmpD
LNVTPAPTQRILPKRLGAPLCAVIHQTGEPSLARCLAWYTHPAGDCPNVLIDTSGKAYRIVPDDTIAYHCGIKITEMQMYLRGWSEWSRWTWHNDRPRLFGDPYPGYASWRDTWRAQGLESPLDLLTGDRPNRRSLGVELLTPSRPLRDGFTDEQYRTLADLLVEWAGTWKLRLARGPVLFHSDVSPMRRCNVNGPWDPGQAFNLLRVWDLLGLGKHN